jgi:hypothetical protein
MYKAWSKSSVNGRIPNSSLFPFGTHTLVPALLPMSEIFMEAFFSSEPQTACLVLKSDYTAHITDQTLGFTRDYKRFGKCIQGAD